MNNTHTHLLPPSVPPGELQDLVRAGVLHPGSSFWQLAFEGVLLELLDAHSQVGGCRGAQSWLLPETAASMNLKDSFLLCSLVDGSGA